MVTLEEFEKLPKRRFPPLVEYVQKRFGSKRRFLSSLSEKTGIQIQVRSYRYLMNEILERIGRQSLYSLLGIKDEREAELRAYLFDALYKSLTEAAWARQLSPLYDEVTGEKIRIVRKIDKRHPAHVLAFETEEEAFTQAWIHLCKKETLPAVLHYGMLTVGALGWLNARHERWEGYYSTVFEIVAKKFDAKSLRVTYGNLLSILDQVSKEPQKFQMPEGLEGQLAQNLKLLAVQKDGDLYSMMSLQLIETYMDDEELCEVIDRLIAQELIEPPSVRRLYERFPYSFSEWIITRYGVFKQSPSWLRNPNKELSELLQREFDQKYLDPDLESYHGSYPLRILQYCIRENPERILKKFGVPRLRKIAEDLGISAALKIKEEEELIRVVMLKLGFNLPPILSGLVDFNRLLEECAPRLVRGESISSVMADVYGETERVLQDIAYFYICFLFEISTRSRSPEEIEVDITRVVRGLRVSDKPFSRLTFGELTKLLRTLNEQIRKNKGLKERFMKTLGLKVILLEDQIQILDEMSKCRAVLFAHKRVKTGSGIPDRKMCDEIISRLSSLSRALEGNKVYPKMVRVTRQVTNEYGTRYFEAIDDTGDEWIVEYMWLDPGKPYFMYSKTYPIAVDPIIIEKIF